MTPTDARMLCSFTLTRVSQVLSSPTRGALVRFFETPDDRFAARFALALLRCERTPSNPPAALDLDPHRARLLEDVHEVEAPLIRLASMLCEATVTSSALNPHALDAAYLDLREALRRVVRRALRR